VGISVTSASHISTLQCRTGGPNRGHLVGGRKGNRGPGKEKGISGETVENI